MNLSDVIIVWAFQGIIAALLAVVWLGIKWAAKRMLDDLKEMNSSLKILSDNSLVHDGEIKLVKAQASNHEKRLNDHTSRLRIVERRQDSCPTCPDSINKEF